MTVTKIDWDKHPWRDNRWFNEDGIYPKPADYQAYDLDIDYEGTGLPVKRLMEGEREPVPNDPAGLSWPEVARAAYQAYGSVTDFKNFRGEPMPEFDALPETIQRAWLAAAKKAGHLAIVAVQPYKS